MKNYIVVEKRKCTNKRCENGFITTRNYSDGNYEDAVCDTCNGTGFEQVEHSFGDVFAEVLVDMMSNGGMNFIIGTVNDNKQ